MKTKLKYSLALIGIVLLFSCKKDKEEVLPEEYTTLKINFSYSVDNAPLIFDSLIYTNDAGEVYAISKLEYYISNITFYRSSVSVYKTDKIVYLSANSSSANSIVLESIPVGGYSYITFNVGIDASRNSSYYLPNTAENIGMAWPEMMGGGYHFMKLEGHYFNNSSSFGYAVHLGKNTNLVSCTINEECSLSYPNAELEFNMNINEWYRTPEQYSFITDGNYTMSDSLLMAKIKSNGADAFSLKE